MSSIGKGCYAASLISVLLSILTWNSRKNEDQAHAERFGIFIGLWAPTLAVAGLVADSIDAANAK